MSNKNTQAVQATHSDSKDMQTTLNIFKKIDQLYSAIILYSMYYI